MDEVCLLLYTFVKLIAFINKSVDHWNFKPSESIRNQFLDVKFELTDLKGKKGKCPKGLWNGLKSKIGLVCLSFDEALAFISLWKVST